MLLAAPPKRPGVRFVSTPPVVDVLPRMDVAGFVGYAAAGPIDVPVCIEDEARFTAVFGDPPTLPGLPGEPPRRGLLAATVRAFLAGGGVRCWVVRAASSELPAPTRFVLPGVVAIAGADVVEAELSARSPGSAFDDLSVSASIASRTLIATDAFTLRGPPAIDVQPGDVLRYDIAGGLAGDQAAIRVGAVVDTGVDADGLRVLRIDPLAGSLVVLGGGGAPAPAQITLPAGRGQVGGRLVQAPSAPGAAAALVVHGLAGTPPLAGEILQATIGTRRLVLSVQRIAAPPDPASDPLDIATVLGAAMWIDRPDPGTPIEPPAAGAAVELLRIGIACRGAAGQAVQRIEDLGLGTGHARWPGRLPADAERYDPGGERLAGRADDRRPADPDSLADARQPLAGGGFAGLDCVLPVGFGAVAGTWLPARPAAGDSYERDGIPRDPQDALLDPALAGTRTEALIGEAQHLRLAASLARRLRGIHALLTVDEATLLAAPDAVQGRWSPAPVPAAPAPPTEAAPDPAAGAAGAFAQCAVDVPPAPTLHAGDATAGGRADLTWAAVPGTAVTYEIQAVAPPATGWTTVAVTAAIEQSIFVGPGVTYLRVRTIRGGATGPWSAALVLDRRPPHVATLDEPGNAPRPDLLAVHRALLRMATARGDALALLSLPDGTQPDQAVAHAAALRDLLALPAPGDVVPPLDFSESQALGFGCLHHPWVVADGAALAPDGPVAGLLADRARTTGAWTAAAGHALPGTVGLDPAIAPEDADVLDDARVNALRSTPRGFMALAQQTLDDDPERADVNVRRLLALLVRLCRLHGPAYVFEPNGPELQRAVQRGFEARLAALHALGAFRGATADEAYRVDVGATVEERLAIELRVAPSVPLRFLLVRLVDDALRGLRVELG